jgi:hypothetical protein
MAKNGSGSRATLAILVIALLAIGAYFAFFAPQTAAPPFATDTPAPGINIILPPAP